MWGNVGELKHLWVSKDECSCTLVIVGRGGEKRIIHCMCW